MKKLLTIYSICLLLFTACTESYDDVVKPGVSLPAVTNLALQQVNDSTVRVSWQLPSSIPAEVQQPLSVNIEVREVINVMKTVSVATVTLPDAPTDFTWELPDPEAVYHITVKLVGVTKTVDVNYSSNIYSLGQTVVYGQ